MNDVDNLQVEAPWVRWGPDFVGFAPEPTGMTMFEEHTY